jgi:hypothetical protein
VASWIITASNYFLEPIWLYALLLMVLFILLYLIRPKPKQKVIPTLMFLFKDLGRDKRMTFFRRLIHDLLFLFQFFALLLILLAAAKPYINVTRESMFKNTVLVIDVSASMKAGYNGETRFENAVEQAKKNLGIINTVILVKKTPEVALIDESSGKAREYLDRLEPTDTPTNLYEAISTAGGYAKENSRVVVISDFIDTETDTSLETAKKTLEAQGIKVDFIKVFEPVNNVGIVDLVIDNEKTSAVIKNFNAQSAEAVIRINSLEETLDIPARSQEVFTFSTPPGTSKVELEVKGTSDGFKEDNVAYISAPSDIPKKVLLITNNAEPRKTYLFNALDVMKNMDVTIAIPPKIPDLPGYDIYIFKDINPNLVLPGTYADVREEVEKNGKAVIIAAQSDLLAVDYSSLLALGYNETIISQGSNINAGTSESLTSNIEFGITKKYFRTNIMEGAKTVVIAGVDDESKTPIITFSTLGAGKIFFYGILDEDKQADTGFAKSPAYFVFWKRVVDFATNTPSIKNLNYKSGSVLSLGEEQSIQTPKGRITTSSLSLENTGLYTLNDRVIAINLINEKESYVSNPGAGGEQGVVQSGQKFQEKIPYELIDYFIIAAVLILLVEFIYIKLRGDL